MQTGSAILEKTYKNIKYKFNKTYKLANFVQIDICDGNLVPSKTFANTARKDSAKKLSYLCKKALCQLDLMVENPASDKWINFIKIVNPKQIIIHDKNTDFEKIFSTFPNIQIILAIHLTDNLTKIKSLLKKFPFYGVQIMGIEKPGYSGQKFSAKTFNKIKNIKEFAQHLPIFIDGGVTHQNVKKLKSAGATHIASSSSIFKHKSGIKNAIKSFLAI